MALQMQGKVAVVTGAASGIGEAVVRRYLAEGARVVGLDRTPSAGAEPGGGGNHVGLTGDVRSAADNRGTVQRALDQFGRLDILVANAGVYDNRRSLRSFTGDDLDAAFGELFDVNVKGCMQSALAATEALVASRGCIIFTSSISGNQAGFGGALYVAAKHAVNGLTRQLALELAPQVRVNAVAPGYVPTGLRGLESLAQASGAGAPTVEQMPLQVFGTPDDYAWAYVFLASDACSRIATGTVLALDGGSGVRGPRQPT